MGIDTDRKKVQELVDAIRRCLTTIDVNIGASSTPDDHKEATDAVVKLDTFAALLTVAIRELNTR